MKLYEELKANNSWKTTNYLAINKISDEEDLFSAAERDKVVKLLAHESQEMKLFLQREDILKKWL
jgi:hypothetical protein